MTSKTKIIIGEQNITKNSVTTYGNNWIWGILIILILAGIGVGLAVGLKSNDSVTSNLNGFTVEYQNGLLVSNFSTHINNATSFWNNILNEPNEIKIEVREETISSNILARARPFSSTNLKGGGIVYFNTNASYHDWDFVTKHELGHIFGIGSNQKWDNNIYQSEGQYYLSRLGFPETYQIYTDQFGGTQTGTPIGDAEGIDQPVTLLSLTALKELGWDNIDLTQAQPYN